MKQKSKKQPGKTRKNRANIRVLFASRRWLFVTLFAIVGCMLIVPSIAAPTNNTSGTKKSGGSVPALAQTSASNFLNPNGPPSCDAEDDYHYVTYYGYLNGNFSTTQTLCNNVLYNGVYWDSGGEGLEAEINVVGSLTDMTISSPTGVVHHAVLVGTSTSKGVTTNHYQVCFVPPYYLSTDTSTNPLSMGYPGNPWTFSLTGNFSSATYYTRDDMTDVTFQRTYCPSTEQNLL